MQAVQSTAAAEIQQLRAQLQSGSQDSMERSLRTAPSSRCAAILLSSLWPGVAADERMCGLLDLESQ